MNTRVLDLADDDLEQVSAGAANIPAAEAANNAALVWRQCGCEAGGEFFDGMATAFGYWTY